MSRFCKLSQIIWHCQYHIVWVNITKSLDRLKISNCILIYWKEVDHYCMPICIRHQINEYIEFISFYAQKLYATVYSKFNK